MSSNERALDLVVVGLGGAGGRIAAEFHLRGYRALALDSSQAELDALTARGGAPSLPEDRRVWIAAEGCSNTGGDPDVGEDAVHDNAQKIRDVVAAQVGGGAGLLLVGGLGGGTGSALATLVEVLHDVDSPPIAVMATLPTNGENATTKVNAARAAHELTKSDLAGLILVDNARITDLNADLPILDYHARVNELIVDPLDGLNALPGRRDLTAIRSFDGSALHDMMFSGGIITYGTNELEVCDADAISDSVMDVLFGSWLVAAGVEPSTVSSLAMVIEAPDGVLADLPVRAVEQLREHWKADTEGGTVEVGVYRRVDDQADIVIRVFAVSTELPLRLTQLVDEAARESRAMRDKRRKLPTLDIGVLDGSLPIPGKEDAITGRYGELRDPIPVRPMPVMPDIPRVENKKKKKDEGSGPRRLPSLPKPETTGDDIDMDVLRKMPGRAAYARIVTRYQTTADTTVRESIEVRLEQDRLSPHAQVRYHAVDAMTKLGSTRFQEALIAATEDEDPAVRTLANKALGETRRVMTS